MAKTRKYRKKFGGNQRARDNWQKFKTNYWEERVKGPETRRLRKSATNIQRIARSKAARLMTKNLREIKAKIKESEKKKEEIDELRKQKKITIKEKKDLNENLSKELEKDEQTLKELYESTTKKQENLEDILSKDLHDNKDMIKFVKFSEAIKNLTKLYKSESEDDKKKRQQIYKIKNSDSYIKGDSLKTSLQQKLEKSLPEKQMKLYRKMLTTINELETNLKDEEERATSSVDETPVRRQTLRSKFTAAQSLLSPVEMNPNIFLGMLEECFEQKTKANIDERYTQNLFENLELTPQSAVEQFSSKDSEKFLIINFNANKAFSVSIPPGGRIESHITIANNDQKGTEFSSHISIKLYNKEGKEIGDYKRYRTAPNGRQPKVRKLLSNHSGTWPQGMKDEDFRKLQAFMAVINQCLDQYEKERKQSFRGGKFKKTKRLKKSKKLKKK
jgi:hypothetical protein